MALCLFRRHFYPRFSNTRHIFVEMQHCAGSRGPGGGARWEWATRFLAHQALGGLCRAWASSEGAMGRSHAVPRKLSSAINEHTRDTVLELMV